MNTNNTTPPVSQRTRKVLFKYDEEKFKKTISRLTKDLLKQITISVYALNPDEENQGPCVNLLSSNLSLDNFDKLAEHAAYTVYEGTPGALHELGVA